MANVGLKKGTSGVLPKLERFWMFSSQMKDGQLIQAKEKVIIFDVPYTVMEHVFKSVVTVLDPKTKKMKNKDIYYQVKCNKSEFGRCVSCETGNRPMARTLLPVLQVKDYTKDGVAKTYANKVLLPINKTTRTQFLHKLGEDYEKWIGTALYIFRGDSEAPSSGDMIEVIDVKKTKEQFLIEQAAKHQVQLDRYNADNFDEVALNVMTNQQMKNFISELSSGGMNGDVDKVIADKGNAQVNTSNSNDGYSEEEDDVPF